VFFADRVAIVHESFAHCGEAERIAEEIAKLAPDADILSAVCVDESLTQYLRSRSMKTTWMNYLPAKEQWSRHYAPLFPFAIRALDMSQYSVVISSCAGFAKGVQCRHDAIHLCYCHTVRPAIWRSKEYARTQKANGAASFLLKPILAGLRQFDRTLAVQPDYYVAKSHTVADQIKQCYGRNAYVVHPPVETSRFYASGTPDDFLLIVSDLSAHKQIDMVIAACNSIGKQLLIVGEGPDRKRLEALAGPSIRFLGPRTESQVADLLSRCPAVFCPDTEADFDTMPLKANASGRPAISFAAGSAFETIANRESGILCWECSRPAIVEAIEHCCRVVWDPVALNKYARDFDVSVFRSKFTAVLEDILGSGSTVGAVA
jgi:glycosyltransferase involved in cell wall biosynthesis